VIARPSYFFLSAFADAAKRENARTGQGRLRPPGGRITGRSEPVFRRSGEKRASEVR
jgi:hypothetical protein